MNSISKLTRFDYESESKSPIRVLQYLLLTTETNEKYLMFRLRNELQQKVKKVEFKLELYNENNFLIEETRFSFEETHNSYEEFIPERKLKIEQEFANLKIVVLSAEFDNVQYKDGQISKIKYTINDFRNDSVKQDKIESRSVEVASKSKWDNKADKLEYKSKKSYFKSEKKNKYAKNIIRINYSKKGRILATIFMLIIIAYFVVSLIYFVNIADGFSDRYFSYEIIENNSVEITKANNKRAELVIPSSVNGYTVLSINKSAFENNSTITSLTVNAKNLKIEAKAFYGCSALKEIKKGENIATVGDSAFYGTALTSVSLPNATEVYSDAFASTRLTYASMPKALVHMNAFNGVSTLNYLNIGETESSVRIIDLFNTTNYDNLVKLHTNQLNVTSSYLYGLNNLNELSLENSNVSITSSAIYNLKLSYLKINTQEKRVNNYISVNDINTIDLNNNDTYANNLLSACYANSIIFRTGKLISSTFTSVSSSINYIYFKSGSNYQEVDFNDVLSKNYNIKLYFEDDIPSIIATKYSSRCKGNVSDSDMRSLMVIAS